MNLTRATLRTIRHQMSITISQPASPEITHPECGETKFDTRPMSRSEASKIAEAHWDVVALEVSGAHTWAVKSRTGYVAIIGYVGGAPSILDKHDGTRTLYRYVTMEGAAQ